MAQLSGEHQFLLLILKSSVIKKHKKILTSYCQCNFPSWTHFDVCCGIFCVLVYIWPNINNMSCVITVQWSWKAEKWPEGAICTLWNRGLSHTYDPVIRGHVKASPHSDGIVHTSPLRVKPGWLHKKRKFQHKIASGMHQSRCVLNALYLTFILTWKRAEESILKPSDPGCLTRAKALGSSTARKALKATLPNDLAWVSGWALSWSEMMTQVGIFRFEWTQSTCDITRDILLWLTIILNL